MSLVALLLPVLASMAIGRPRSGNVRLYLAGDEASLPYGYVAVVFVNASASPIWLRQDLDRTEFSDLPLVGHITDVKTGKRVGAAFCARRTVLPLRESTFIRVAPSRCFGVWVSLNGYQLVRGRGYKVHFTYDSKAPVKLGSVRPYRGTLVSEMSAFTYLGSRP